MFTHLALQSVLQEWSTLLGDEPRLAAEQPGRELWPVTAADGRRYFLKRLGPWRNLPVADQARVQSHLSAHGVQVTGFMITDRARVFAGEVEDSFVLSPALPEDRFSTAERVAAEGGVGHSVAVLHRALAAYPWPVNSYREQIVAALSGDLMLPADILERLDHTRSSIIDQLGSLPVQLVHGDLTPENVLLSRSGHPAAFIDFDHLPLAPRVWDIGKYLSRRFRHPEPSAVLSTVTRFISGYHRSDPLTDHELDAVPAATIAANLLEADWMARIASGQLRRRQLPGHDNDLRTTLDTLRWQLDHTPALLDAVHRDLTAGLPRPARDTPA